MRGLPAALADRLRITRKQARQRIAEAAELGPRRALTGQPLPPLLTATAKAQRQGGLGAGHVQVIRDFLQQLPSAVDAGTREQAEAQLAGWATVFRPDEVTKLAQRITEWVNPDGPDGPDGQDTQRSRQRRRGLSMTAQDRDGMSRLYGWISPELRAGLEAIWAKLATPGRCNPDDQVPVVDADPPAQTVRRDTRSSAQRQHDGLPASIIVSTTLAELESAAGKALTGGGSLLPMSDVIRLARHAHHYLAVFDQGKAIGLYHAKRLASPGQRLVLYAHDRGCTRPGYEVPGYRCEVHHVAEWATTHRSDINDLTFACRSDHKLLDKGWTTRKRANGDTEWIPPPHWIMGNPAPTVSTTPERLLTDDEDDGP